MTSQFPVCVWSGKCPFDATPIDVTPLLLSGDLGDEGCAVGQAPAKTWTLQDADLDLGHVEPARMLGRVGEDNTAQQGMGRLAPEHLLESAAKVDVPVVQNQMNAARPGVDLLDELAREGHEVGFGASLGDHHGTPAASGLHGHKQIAGAGERIRTPAALARPAPWPRARASGCL